jgi:deoxycytidine triphosphate deaminase
MASNPADRKETGDVARSLAENENDRAAELVAAQGANAAPPGGYALTREDATELFLKTRAADPFPEIQPSLLNSADIADYVRLTGMIVPFHPEKLKTASYEVKLLGKWTFVDEHGNVQRGELKEGEEFILRRNSIAFMTAEPFFQLPDYIALRHNLKISHVYKGLLVGTGPLIDPGFTGRISLPIHNLTESNYTLRGGDGIIWVEFTKLSRTPASSPLPVSSRLLA